MYLSERVFVYQVMIFPPGCRIYDSDHVSVGIGFTISAGVQKEVDKINE